MTDEDTTETRHNVNESADKIRMSTSMKRGSDTRDQDDIKVKVRGDDPAEVASDLSESLEELEETSAIARNIQPGAPEPQTVVFEFDGPIGDLVEIYDSDGKIITDEVGGWSEEDGFEYLTLEVVRDG